jgi:polyphosphate glucokinase
LDILGIDIGGTGIKGAPVDIETGNLLEPRLRILTPESAKPGPIAEVVAEIVKKFNWQGPVGVGFPAAVRAGVVRTAANIHQKWIGTPIESLFSEATGCPTYVVNDADAAGMAEMEFGAGRDRQGVVLIVTIGTGLGTALFTDQRLLPNTEFGHIEINCLDAELRASDQARKLKKLSWKKWAKNLDEYLHALERYIWPDLIILGGGVSKKYEKFVPYLTVEAELCPAALLNEAGIVGAALAAHKRLQQNQATS